MSEFLQIAYCALSDVGVVRDHNEDDFCVIIPHKDETSLNGTITFSKDDAGILAVADGMGGMEAGEVASRIAIETIQSKTEFLQALAQNPTEIERGLIETIEECHRNILKTAKEHPEEKGMGTTLIIAYVHQDKLYLAWCGDSRAYVFDNNGVDRTKPYDLPKLKILSNDHSYVWEKVIAGELTAEEARTHQYSNVITQSLGDPSSAPAPESAVFNLKSGQKIILCSDGLNSMLPDEIIEEILSSEGTIKENVDGLIHAANEAGGHDNTTVILLDIVNVPPSLDLESTPSRPQAITTKSGMTAEEVSAKMPIEKKSKSLFWLYLVSLILGVTLLGGYVYQDLRSRMSHADNASEINNDPELLGGSNHTIADSKTNVSQETKEFSEKPPMPDSIMLERNIQYVRKIMEPFVAYTESRPILNQLEEMSNILETAKQDSALLKKVEYLLNQTLQEVNTLRNKYPDVQKRR